jgi:hypothetical protein
MSKNNRDVKFIIYQVLYIFVIVVITMKGADLNLMKVMTEEEAVKKTYADSLKKYIDSMLALGLVPKIELDSLRNLADLRNFIPPQITPNMITLQTGQVVVSQTELERLREQKKEEEKQPENIEMSQQEIAPLKAVPLVQYTVNQVSNPYNQEMQIIGDDGGVIASVPPNGSRQFTMGGQKSVTYKVSGQSKTASTKENQKPTINFQALNSGSEDASLRALQNTVGFRVTIVDDFVGQLDVTFTGPVKVETKGNGVYDIVLKYAASKEQFERISEGKDSPFRASFTVTVKDKIAPHSVTRQAQYTFGEW